MNVYFGSYTTELSRKIFIFLYLNVECNSQEGNEGHVWRGQRGAGGGCRLVFCYEFISKSNTIPVLYSAAARHSNNFTRTSTSTTTLHLHIHLSMIHSAAAARDVDVYSIQFGYSAPPTAGVKMACSNVFHF